MIRLPKNKKGGLYFVMVIILIFCTWAFWLGSFLSEWGNLNIVDNGLTGFEAMFYGNLNIIFFLCFLVMVYIGVKFGGETP